MTDGGASNRRIGRGEWGCGAALLLFVAGRCLVPMDETDLFYNLRLGEIILSSRTVPRTNLLSFTVPDYPDPNLAWLFQILLALVHRAGGIAGTVVLKTAFVVATFALLFVVALRRGAHPALAAATLALAAWTAEPRFVERPHLVTFLGLATLLLALQRAEEGPPLSSRAIVPWGLLAGLPFGLLWANGNSCFFLAPALLLLYALGAWLDAAAAPLVMASQNRARARQALWAALLLLPLLFATPSGARWLGYVANHFRMPTLRPLQEYRPAEWPTDGPFMFLLTAVALVTIFPLLRHPRSQTTPDQANDIAAGLARHLLPVLAMALLGSRRIRFVAEFALLAGPYVAARASRIWLPASRARRLSPVVAVALLLLTLLPRLRAVTAADGKRPIIDLSVEAGLVPFNAIRWLDQHDLRDRLYNDLEVGSYMTWDGWPAHRVFQDPRINAYPPELHAILRRANLDRPQWQALMDRFDVGAALITYPDVNPRAALFEPALWALCYQATDALVFVRRTSPHASLIATAESPLTFRFTPDAGVTALPLERRPESSPLPDCEWNRRVAALHHERGDVAKAAAAYRAALADDIDCLPAPIRDATREQAAALALRSGEAQRAADLLAGLPSPSAVINRGFALLQLDQLAAALSTFEAAVGAAPNEPQAHFGRALALARIDRRPDAGVALRDFLRRWPRHLAAAEARALLDKLGGAGTVSRPGARSPL